MKNLFGKSGQTLLEVVVTIGISSIIILSIVALGITVQRNATFARTSTQASKLAEEGVELVRSIRDQEGSVTGFNRIVRIRNCVDPNNPTIINLGTCDFRSKIADGGKQDYQEWKEVTITVSWTDSRGLHEAKQVTVLRSIR